MFANAKKDPKRLSFDELLAVKRQVDVEIAARQATEVDALKAKITTTAAALGVSLADLFGIKVEPPPVERRSKRQPRVRYRDPANPENTWSGRGRPKRWVQAYIDEGRGLDEFKVA